MLQTHQLGSLQTFLLVVLAVGSIPFGFLADRSAARPLSLRHRALERRERSPAAWYPLFFFPDAAAHSSG